MNAYECCICCNEYKSKRNPIICPQCNNVFCIKCQKMFEKDECIICHMKFKKSFIIEHLGKTFVTKTIVPKIIDKLMLDQKELLVNAQPLVEWEKQTREQKKKLRFGIKKAIPKRPTISTEKRSNIVFPCPKKECRGFVEHGFCTICKTKICMKCREIELDNHVCNVEVLQSIALLSNDSKPCPKCCAIIFKTFGCNDMYCTNCHTHFNWINGQIKKNSSNGHYLNLQKFTDNIPTRTIDINGSICNDTAGFSMYSDKIKRDDVIKKLGENTIRCLWDDANAIRLLKRKKYYEQEITDKSNNSLQDLQIIYLMNEITEKKWRQRVYQTTLKKTVSFLYSDILNIYLSTVDIFQQTLYHNVKEEENVMKQYTELVDLCNESFQSIFDEYGGTLHHIRQTNENTNDPPFV